MTNVFEMMKQAATMRKELKRIQSELAARKVEASNGGVTVVVSCDLAIQSVKVEPSLLDPGRVEKLEGLVVSTVNRGLTQAKKEAAAQMSQLTGGLGGLGGLMGG